MPAKRFDRRLIDFMTRPEVDALLNAQDRSTWKGRRDHALLLTTLQTGLRLSEVTGLKQRDITVGTALMSRSSARGASSAPFRSANLSPQSSKRGSTRQAPRRTASSSQACAAVG
jgi:integrase